jgi:hypothetical protein
VRGESALGRSVVRWARTERHGRGEPRLGVTVLALCLQPRAERDQLGEFGDRADAARRGDPDEPVRVQVVPEQQRELVVRWREESGPAVVAEVTLVDRLEPPGEQVVAER